MHPDMKQNCDPQGSLLAVNPPFLSNVGPGASRGSSEERECVSRPLPGRDLPSEGTAARRVSVFSALQMRSLRVRVEPGLGLPALLSRLV